MDQLKGLIAAPFTPLDEQGQLQLKQIDAIARLYEKNGVTGAFICGSTGEGVSLTFEEKKQVMQRWGEVKGEKVKAIFMLGGTALEEMKQLAAYAQQGNMDGISILCPYYFKPRSLEQLVDFCKQVADTAPEMPFYYYHIPALTGGHFSMLEFLKLAETQIPNLAGIKYTHPDIMDFHACTRYKQGQYDLLWGIDEGLLSGLAIGAQGAVGSTYNYAAPLYNKIIRAYQNGQQQQAEALQFKAVQMVQLLQQYGGTAAGKAFMKIIGVDCGWFRPPIGPLSEKAVHQLEKDLETIGFFDFCSQL